VQHELVAGADKILLGNVIVLIPILLNSHPGTKYGIPFPVFARAGYGTYGSNLPALMRAIVAWVVWHSGMDRWRSATHLLQRHYPGWPTLTRRPIGGHAPTEWLSFLLFWGTEHLHNLSRDGPAQKSGKLGRSFVLIMTSLLLGWAIWKATRAWLPADSAK